MSRFVTPCSSCKAPMVFGTTAAGKPLPLDAAPVLVGGSYELDEAGFATYVAPAKRDGRPLYVAHFATCPQSAAHRRRK